VNAVAALGSSYAVLALVARRVLAQALDAPVSQAQRAFLVVAGWRASRVPPGPGVFLVVAGEPRPQPRIPEAGTVPMYSEFQLISSYVLHYLVLQRAF
jgi:hypothetical protein